MLWCCGSGVAIEDGDDASRRDIHMAENIVSPIVVCQVILKGVKAL